MKSLDPPPLVLSDPKAREIVRVWGAHGKMHITLDPHLWDDPGCWGIMLADLAQHVANAYLELRKVDRDLTLKQIRAGFECEWNSPTEDAAGSVNDVISNN